MKRFCVTIILSLISLSQVSLACEIPVSKIRFLAPQERSIDPKDLLGSYCVDESCLDVVYVPTQGYLIKSPTSVIGNIQAKTKVKGHPLDILSSSLELDPLQPETLSFEAPILKLASKLTGASTDELRDRYQFEAAKWLKNLKSTNLMMNFDLVFLPTDNKIIVKLNQYFDIAGTSCSRALPIINGTDNWLIIKAKRNDLCTSLSFPLTDECPKVISIITLAVLFFFLAFVAAIIYLIYHLAAFVIRSIFAPKAKGPTD